MELVLKKWPPMSYGTYSMRGRSFIWKEDEPFVTKAKSGEVDTDLQTQAPGFLNRIMRHAKSNGFAATEWDVQTIYQSIFRKMPAALQKAYFETRSAVLTPPPLRVNPKREVRPHTALLPLGLLDAAKAIVNVGEVNDEREFLALLSPEQWLKVLRKWKVKYPAEATLKAISGPPWWYALHSVALNPPIKGSPGQFVNYWLAQLPCPLCKSHFRQYLSKHTPPKDWSQFAQWASGAHDWVSAHKE